MHPVQRFDNLPFADGDVYFKSVSGKPCSIGAMLYFKADLAEFGNPAGFPTTASATDPCFLCTCTRADLVKLDGWDALNTPWADKSWADYNATCSRCEHWVTIYAAEFETLKTLLVQGRKKAKGFALCLDYPALGLKQNDRLEAHDDMPDYCDFYNLTSFPARLLFWRSDSETLTRRRNPFFSEETGCTPQRIGALDWLHTLSLGVFQTYIAFLVHLFLRHDAYSTGFGSYEEKVATSIPILSSGMDNWQSSEARKGRVLTRVNVDEHTFGASASPACNLKGGETNWLLEFLVSVELPRIGAKLGAHFGPLLTAGQNLMDVLSLIHKHPFTFPIRDVFCFHNAAKSYLTIMTVTFGFRSKPKDHFMIHMARRIQRMGSPALYANWADEAKNKLLRDIAGSSHSLVHDRRILVEFPFASEVENKRRRSR